jgi:hypothetical protein
MNSFAHVHEGLRFATAAKAATAVGVATMIAFCLVVQNRTLKALNEDLSEKEKIIAKLEDDIKVKKAQVAQLKTPGALQRRILFFKLDVAEIREDQIVRMYDSPTFRSGENMPKLARAVSEKEVRP